MSSQKKQRDLCGGIAKQPKTPEGIAGEARRARIGKRLVGARREGRRIGAHEILLAPSEI